MYGRTGRLTAQNGGFRPGQKHKQAIRDSFSKCAESVLRYHAYAKLNKTRHLVISVQEGEGGDDDGGGPRTPPLRSSTPPQRVH